MLISKKLKQIYEVIASDKAPFICHAAADLCEEGCSYPNGKYLPEVRFLVEHFGMTTCGSYFSSGEYNDSVRHTRARRLLMLADAILKAQDMGV